MASAHITNGGNADTEKEVREIQELFKGRYPQDVIHDLLNYFHSDKKATVDHLFKGRLSEEEDQCDELKALNTRLNSLNLKDDAVTQLDKKIESRVRQFACGGCDRVWWQRVPVRKEVSRCQKCQKRFDPVPKDEEYGWAQYNCECGHKFSGFGQVNKTTSECYQCGASVLTSKVKPPRGRKIKKSDSAHQCDAADCSFKDCTNNTGPKGGNNRSRGASSKAKAANAECVHPRTRAKKGKQVVVASSPHVSTGSTVDTFLAQDLGVLSDDENVVILSGDEAENGDRLRPIPENK
ncbi:shiftless antiviral inhibitor of ribosomal frameshifting protein homolog [Amphiura filiformis]|uniref:shiftless antiviral inhibitor of ribosomal frameshifting protein homolog n=1 Tax=Amphiura filiformis TaxID=82378 RepID=UPI003B210B6D